MTRRIKAEHQQVKWFLTLDLVLNAVCTVKNMYAMDLALYLDNEASTLFEEGAQKAK